MILAAGSCAWSVVLVRNPIRLEYHTLILSIACVAGASVICVDVLLCRIPRYKNFRIQDSNAFLAASLSLSFGVMVCLSLLP